MDDDWQSAAFTSRHMHNRVQNRSSRKHRPFDVHKTFGSYECKCAAWRNGNGRHKDGKGIVLELYRLSSQGEGIIGEIRFPGTLDAAVILSGSRASLNRTVQQMESATGDELKESAGSDGHASNESGTASDNEDNLREHESEEESPRFRKFEKNSFRTPKFWLRWSGTVEESKVITGDLGYVVFSGNECRKFKGTISCAPLGWKDVTISGHKIATRGASDIPVTWKGNVI